MLLYSKDVSLTDHDVCVFVNKLHELLKTPETTLEAFKYEINHWSRSARKSGMKCFTLVMCSISSAA